MQAPPIRVLLDVDEVLADFVGGALAVHGWTRERLEDVWPEGTWSIPEWMGLTQAQFWDPINREGAQFWIRLHALPWALDLIDLVNRQTTDWFLVTSPGLGYPETYAGKAAWIKCLLGEDFDRIVLTSHKHLLARPGTLLIDDRESTISEFIRCGGAGMLFPSRHNCLYSKSHDPIQHVRERLDKVRASFEKEQFNALHVSQCQPSIPFTRYGLL